LGILVAGLGVSLGYLLSAPGTSELLISVLAILVFMLVIARRPLNGVLVWLILVSFIETWIKIPMGAGIPDLSFSRFTIAFLAVFMLARAAIGRFRFARIGVADVCIVAMTIGIMIAAPLSDDPTHVIQTAVSLHFTPLTIYFFAKNLVRNKSDLHRLFVTVVLFGFVLALYVIYQQTTGTILFLPKGESTRGLKLDYTESLRRVQGLLGGPGNFGRVLISTIPISFYLFFENRGITRKILLVGVMLVQAYGIFLTYNRTSWYALLLSLTVLQFLYPQFRRAYVVIVLVAAVALWASWGQVNESAVVTERINSKVSTLEKRESYWNAAYHMWLAKPIRGWGFGRYGQESGRFRTAGERTNLQQIENDYLYILVGSGLIGFLPYLLFLLVPLLNSVRLLFRARAPDWSGFIKPETIVVYWAVLISFAIGSYTQKQTKPIVKMIPFALAGAVVGSHAHVLRGSKAEKEALDVAKLDHNRSDEMRNKQLA
jgi:O-antigen ligase